MLNLASTNGCNGTCLIFAIWLLAAQGGLSIRNTVDIDAKREACVELQNNQKEKLVTATPAEVYLIINRRNLTKEYDALTESLFHAQRGTLGVFKTSALYRSMYILGHEKAFNAKDVSLYLTKTAQKVGSKIQICLVDRTKEADYMPSNIYTEGRVLEFKKGPGCETRGCESLGQLKKGVYGLIYDDFHTPPSNKLTLPVDLLKLLDEKDALIINMDMIAMIATGTKSGFTAARAVSKFKKQFQAKGINIFYAQNNLCQGYEHLYSLYLRPADHPEESPCHEWHHWFEYVDIDVAGIDYKPTLDGIDLEYPTKFLDWYEQCKNGDTRELAKRIALDAGQVAWGGCGDVAGATKREKVKSKCKCRNANHQVYCGDSLVAGRKFDFNSVISFKACKERTAYCNVRACYPPTGDRP